MRDYIKNWLNKSLTKITKPNQEEAVVTGQVVPTKESIKDTPRGR